MANKYGNPVNLSWLILYYLGSRYGGKKALEHNGNADETL